MSKTHGNRIMSEFSGSPIDQLKQLMERLRHPTEGCPWDREQSFETVAPGRHSFKALFPVPGTTFGRVSESFHQLFELIDRATAEFTHDSVSMCFGHSFETHIIA